MGHTFTFGDIEAICRSLGWVAVPRRLGWRRLGRDGRMMYFALHSHGPGKEIATGTARAIARRLGFATLAEMADYLRKL